MGNQVIANQEDFVAVANAIRSKAGTTANMSFPNEFISTVNNIETVDPEYVTVTYNYNSRSGYVSLTYRNENGEWKNISSSISQSITVKKNDLIFARKYGSSTNKYPSISISGDYTTVTSMTGYSGASSSAYSNILYVYMVHGDVTLS